MPAPPDEFLTAKQAAKEIGVAYRTVLGWIRSGHLRGERVGPRVYRIRRSALSAIGS